MIAKNDPEGFDKMGSILKISFTHHLMKKFTISFRISATYEMRTTKHGEICISNDNQSIGEEGFYMKRKGEEREQTDRETERERACVCVCVCVLVGAEDSVGRHPQTA